MVRYNLSQYICQIIRIISCTFKKSNIDKIRDECYKAKRDPKDIHIAAILYPIVTEEQKAYEEKPKQRPLLSGSVDEIGKDFQEIKKVGVDHAIPNYNRSSMNSNNIDNIIDISKQFSAFLKQN
jgi:hypothetical protein